MRVRPISSVKLYRNNLAPVSEVTHMMSRILRQCSVWPGIDPHDSYRPYTLESINYIEEISLDTAVLALHWKHWGNFIR